jgi:hypothetical protein
MWDTRSGNASRMRIAFGLFLIGVGVAQLVFRKRLAESSLAFYEGFLGRQLGSRARLVISVLTVLFALFFLWLGGMLIV